MSLLIRSCQCVTCSDQDARPDSDIDTGSWVIAGSSPESTFWESIDEWPDTGSVDLIHSEQISNGATSSTCKIGLSTITDQEISTGHKMEATWGAGVISGTPTIDIQVDLYDGATLIATMTDSKLAPSGFVDISYTLTSGEADSITDYSDLRLWFTASVNAGTDVGQCNVYAARFTVTCP